MLGMTTKPIRKRRASKPAPTHPAILAIRAEHAAFAARHSQEDLHSCFFSDLLHDERAIHEHAPQVFGWIIHPHSTHLRRGPIDAGEARADMIRDWRETRTWCRNVADAYGPDRCAYYVWDGTALIRCVDAEDVARRMLACTARIALPDAEQSLTEAREDLAASRGEGVWHDRCAARVRDVEREIADLRAASE